MSKACTKCGETKPLDNFHRKKAAADGRQSRCKECKRRYYEDNLDKKREYDRRYRKENRDKRREYQRRYYEENRDIIRQGQNMRGAQYARTSNLLASKKGAPYSPEEDTLILCDNGMTDYQKAIELGRTQASVTTRKHHLRARANH